MPERARAVPAEAVLCSLKHSNISFSLGEVRDSRMETCTSYRLSEHDFNVHRFSRVK